MWLKDAGLFRLGSMQECFQGPVQRCVVLSFADACPACCLILGDFKFFLNGYAGLSILAFLDRFPAQTLIQTLQPVLTISI